jgi:NADPH:quinone reductase-like Zn-dependent oxidoreductase
MALEAAQRRAEKHGVAFSRFELREVVVGAALVLSDDLDAETTITLRPYAEGTRGTSDIWDEFRICSWTTKRGWTEHCSGLVGVRSGPSENGNAISGLVADEKSHVLAQIAEVDAASTYKIETERLYQVLTDLGAEYGITFQGLENCFADPHHSRADLHVRDTKSIMPKGFEPTLNIHPAFLDGLLHLVWPILGQGRMELDTLYMPTMIKHASISRNIPSVPGEHVKVYGTGNPHLPSPEPTKFDLFATHENSSDLLIKLEGLVMTPIRDAGAGGSGDVRKLCYKFEWQPLHAELANGHVETVNGHAEPVANGHVETVNGQVEPATNGHAEPVANGHVETAVNGKVETNGHAVTNGETATNGTAPNGHAIPNGNTHVNGHEEEPEILIAQFGESDIADQVADAIGMANSRPQICKFEDIDGAQKNVVILQTGKGSLRVLTEALFGTIKRTLLDAANVLWVYRTDNPDAQMVVGLARSVRSETLAKVATLGLNPEDLNQPTKPIMAAIDALWVHPSGDFEFNSKGSQLLVPRAVEDDASNSFIHNETHEITISKQPFSQPERRFKIQIGSPGALDTLYFADDDAGPLGDDHVEIEVKATGVNFKDIVVSMGQLAQPYIGIECSGVIAAVGKNVTDVQVGQRVMAMPEGAYSTYARCLSTSVAPIPEGMSFEVASTVPVVFCTAYYGLFDLSHLQAGERVLIHAGAGGVGQAAIMMAKMIGADAFVTVGSLEKKRFLMTQYGIPEDRIFYSRDTSFGPAIRRATNNEGVDVVINSLAGDLLRETWECLAPFGRFIEIGKADITKNSRLDMLKFEYNVTFSSVDLTKVAKYRPRLMKRIFDDVCRLLSDGSVKPISPITTYRIAEIETAFRTLQTGKNTGKVVVVPHPDDQVKVSESRDPEYGHC